MYPTENQRKPTRAAANTETQPEMKKTNNNEKKNRRVKNDEIIFLAARCGYSDVIYDGHLSFYKLL